MIRVALAAGVAICAILAANPAAALGGAKFPADFLWGTAGAGFQSEAGRGKHVDPNSDWYAWTHDAANIADGTVSGELPEQGPGHWKLYKRDFDLAAEELNNNAIRFSIEWPRIFPRSTESIDVGAKISKAELERLDRRANQNAVRHYAKVLKAATARGLTPFVTLHHWTLPSWLHDPAATRDALAGRDPNADLPELTDGGWLDQRTVDEFRKYAAYLGWKLGNRADYWNTLNEPLVQVANGFVNVPGLIGSYWPPGAFSFTGAITTLLNLERANTVAYDALKRFDRSDADGDHREALVGPVMNMVAFTPADPNSPADQEATEHADYLFNRLFLNAVVRGELDRNADGAIGADESGVHRRKADFVGLNYYFRGRVSSSGGAPLTPKIPILDFLPATSYATSEDSLFAPCPSVCSELGAEIYPQGFSDVIATADSYGLPVYITENGIADGDDDQRPAYLRDHLAALADSIDAGADVRGYFEWSLVDNLEWVYGYGPKFGLYSFDPATLKRTPRPSAKLYGRIAKRNRLP